MFAEVFLASFFLQLFALATPLFFQVVTDKVLVYRGYTTLDVLVAGLLTVSLFETVLGGFKRLPLVDCDHPSIRCAPVKIPRRYTSWSRFGHRKHK
jgi:ABC-type bacteriocin/lantibiotic exporter with double-glycine peptidase domain